MSSELGDAGNPRKWRFTWEAQSQIPTFKLLLFNPDSNTKPSTQCHDLKVNLLLQESLLTLTWFEAGAEVSLRVPIPRVLVDPESPLQCRALDDHIEVKLVLLLPVDHPILTSLDSVLNLSDDESRRRESPCPDYSRPLSMESDVESLSSAGEVQFYCRSCSTQLTRSLRYEKYILVDANRFVTVNALLRQTMIVFLSLERFYLVFLLCSTGGPFLKERGRLSGYGYHGSI